MEVIPPFMRSRWQRVWSAMGDAGVDTLLVAGRAGIGEYGALHYLTGHYPFSRLSFALMRSGQEPMLLLSSPSEVRAVELEAEYYVNATQIPVAPTGYGRAVANIVGASATGKVGVVRGDLLGADLLADLKSGSGLEMYDCTSSFEKVRSTKDEEDFDQFRQTARMVISALNHAIEHVRPGQTEQEIAASVEAVMRAQGAQLMLVFVSRAAFFGQRPTSRLVSATDTVSVLVEACGRSGYWVEMGILLAMHGAPADAKPATACLAGLLNGASALRADAPFPHIANAIENPIRQAGFELSINLGHRVGVDEERPAISSIANNSLSAPAAIALHPSAAKEDGDGAVVANTYLVTSLGVEPLSLLPHQIQRSFSR